MLCVISTFYLYMLDISKKSYMKFKVFPGSNNFVFFSVLLIMNQVVFMYDYTFVCSMHTRTCIYMYIYFPSLPPSVSHAPPTDAGF